MDFILQCIFRDAKAEARGTNYGVMWLIVLLPGSSSASFLYLGQAHLPRHGTTHSGLGPSTSISNVENVPQTYPQAKANKNSSLIENFSSQAVRLTTKITHHAVSL